jgi:hypothetical protein
MLSLIYPFLMVAVTLALVVLAGACVRLRRGQRRDRDALGQELRQLQGIVSALVAGAAGADRRAERWEQRQSDLRQRLDDLEERQRASRPYDEAIRLVRQGATGQRLVQELGLSPGEADLLIRLHGHRESGVSG